MDLPRRELEIELAALRDENERLKHQLSEGNRAEEELRRSEALFNSMIESLPLNIYAKSLEGQFILVNKREPEITQAHKVTKGITEYNKEFYKEHHNNESVEVFYEVSERVDTLVSQFGWQLEKKFNKGYIVYKHGFFNVFGITWIGSKSFALFFKVPTGVAEEYSSLQANMPTA